MPNSNSAIPSSGSNVTRSGSSGSWTNPGNAVSANSSFATFPVTGNGTSTVTGTSDYLKMQTITGMSVPSNATIIAVQGEIQRNKTSAGIIGNSKDLHVFAVQGGSIQTGATDVADTATQWTTGNTYKVYGDLVSNLLGVAWTAADFQDGANSGIAIAVTCTVLSTQDDVTAQVDNGRMTVAYTVPSGIAGIETYLKGGMRDLAGGMRS